MINKERLFSLTQQLIRIDSQDPPGDERAIALFVGNYLKRLGLRVRLHEFKKRRTNVVALLPGESRKRSLLLTPHLDTVPAGRNWRMPALRATVHNGKIYGLGATDCKGNLACGLEAIASLVEEKVMLGYDLIFAATADEESGSSLGLIPLLDKGIVRPTQALVLDADDFSIIVCQKGLIHLKVKLLGKRAHGAYPWLGNNAIDMALKILQEIKKHTFIYSKNRYLKPPTINIGTIQGGDKVNVVADWCEFELDFRFLPGMSAHKILADLKRIIGKHARNFKLEIEGIQKPYAISEGHPLVSILAEAIKRVHKKPVIKGSEGATVITFFQQKGIPAVATGFGCEGCAHVADEYVSAENLHKGALALEIFLKEYRLA